MKYKLLTCVLIVIMLFAIIPTQINAAQASENTTNVDVGYILQFIHSVVISASIACITVSLMFLWKKEDDEKSRLEEENKDLRREVMRITELEEENRELKDYIELMFKSNCKHKYRKEDAK